jgi:ubiquitin carboxyl-terminal hydrolase 34
LFNDAEVKSFDAANQLAAECFGGETTSKTYDSSTDKFMDLSVEKSNSAYMLFYEKKNKKSGKLTRNFLPEKKQIPFSLSPHLSHCRSPFSRVDTVQPHLLMSQQQQNI